MNLKVFNDKKSLKGLASLFLLLPVFFLISFYVIENAKIALEKNMVTKVFQGNFVHSGLISC